MNWHYCVLAKLIPEKGIDNFNDLIEELLAVPEAQLDSQEGSHSMDSPSLDQSIYEALDEGLLENESLEIDEDEHLILGNDIEKRNFLKFREENDQRIVIFRICIGSTIERPKEDKWQDIIELLNEKIVPIINVSLHGHFLKEIEFDDAEQYNKAKRGRRVEPPRSVTPFEIARANMRRRINLENSSLLDGNEAEDSLFQSIRPRRPKKANKKKNIK